MEAVDNGLVVYRASRIEALLTPLLGLLAAAPPAHVLAPHELIAAHPGMRNWLGRELARRAGPTGIAANLRIELPGAWLDRLAREVLGVEAVALRPYRREFLRWRIHARLAEGADPAFAAWLDAEPVTRERRRFELADHLAALYSQYLVYRPDWLADWARDCNRVPGADGLAALWWQLRHDIAQPHRGERINQLITALERDAGAAREPLHVFGIAHLAPAELALLRAVARRRLVALYVPDPCREYWGGLRSELAQLRELVARDPQGAASEGAFLDQGHPLLGAWGRMGQHFVLALDEIGARLDTRHHEDAAAAAPASRLEGVQESIRRCDPRLIGEHAAAPRADASLRVHACHTRLRELEVLRDALLQARVDDPALRPADIAVLLPDVHAYLPLLPAVFGVAGRAEGPLPYHCADVAVRHAHPLFEAFRRLLELPSSRLTAPEVIDLLALPPIAAQLGVTEVDRVVIERWLEESRAAWGLDGAFRARFEVPPISEHTHGWAVDRLLAGHVLGATADPAADVVELPDGTRLAPLAGAQGAQADLLGELDRLLGELHEACADDAQPRRASEWSARLEARLDRLFRVAADDTAGRDALERLREFVRAIAAEPADAGLDPLLDFTVVRELLLAQLDGIPARQSFLLGGVTFCGMVPQRAIPFRMIAVLGLDDGAFPRGARARGIDPMREQPRLGDRDVRSDDRYLFLETVMAARWRLHLSWLGEGVRSGKPLNPAAPLAELLAALAAAHPPAPDEQGEAPAWRAAPWLVRHPLQPFDARYFDGGDPALYSYRADWAALQGGVASRQPPWFVASDDDTVPASAADPAPVALRTLLAYYRDPARTLLEDVLDLRLDALREDRLRESEPLTANTEALDRIAARVFVEQARRGTHGAPADAPEWLRLTGLLPPGRLGEAAWQGETQRVDALFAAIAAAEHPAHALFTPVLPPAQVVAIDLEVGGHRLRGEVREVHENAAGRWLLRVKPGKPEEELAFADRIVAFLEWALLRLVTPHTQAVRIAVVAAPGKNPQPSWSTQWYGWDAAWVKAKARERERLRAELAARVGGLVDFWRAAQVQPRWYFPKTSWAALEGDAEAIATAWESGEHHTGERDYAPGYASLLAGERDFTTGQAHARLARHARALRALIEPDVSDAGGGR